MLQSEKRETVERSAGHEGMTPPPARPGDEPTESDLYGEYSSPTVSLPGWGFASLLMALPGVALPWLLPAMIRNGYAWSALRPLFLIVPVTALLGLAFGIVGVRRKDGGASALVGLGLNVVLVMVIAAYVVARFF